MVKILFFAIFIPKKVPDFNLYCVLAYTVFQLILYFSLYRISANTVFQRIPYFSLYGILAYTVFQYIPYFSLYCILHFSHADSIYQGIADHIPMVIFICVYLLVTLSVCFYIQWDVTLAMFAALPLLIGTRLIFSKVYF